MNNFNYKISSLKLYLLLVVISMIFTACADRFSEFQEQAITFARSNNNIDEQEYKALVEFVKTSDDDKLKNFFLSNQEIDNRKLVDYLLKFFKTRNITLSEADIWTPNIQTTTNSKFNIDVYVENSASMDGYVNGVTEFETAIYNLLGEVKISEICESLNLNYINKSITYTKPNALAPDIQDFIEKLEPSTFKQRGGDRGVSDLKNILKTVIGKVDEKNAAILVSDFVFSPGSNNNAQDYLNNQQVGIKIDFAEKLKEFDLAAVVIQLQSNFSGQYYDRSNKPIMLNTKRPYYIWVFGSNAQIKAMLDKKVLDNIKGGYQNRIVFTTIKNTAPLQYKILLRPRIGDFNLASGAGGGMTEASVSEEIKTKGLFGFNVAVNFSNSIQDTNYFLDSANYRLSNTKYTLTVEAIKSTDEALKGFTHMLKLQTTELSEETLKIDVIGKMPSWVENSTSVDDSGIAGSDTEKQKTFGLKYLVEGVSDSFYPQSKENVINTISISIKK